VKTFEVVIQLGAILAVCLVYLQRLLKVVQGLPGDPAARRFATAVIVGFLPAAVVGALAHDYIKNVLFASKWVVPVALIVGGFAILAIERMRHRPKVFEVESFSAPLSLGIGAIQCLAMVPGVSRSGATIMGGLALGVDRRAAAEYSFFLAIPTMLGATVLDLYKSRHDLSTDGAGLIAIGFVTAFLSAILVVRWLISFISRHGFTPFAWYRIAAGAAMIAFLTFAA
jgi:undecaprenyl-diphosphatase